MPQRGRPSEQSARGRPPGAPLLLTCNPKCHTTSPPGSRFRNRQSSTDPRPADAAQPTAPGSRRPLASAKQLPGPRGRRPTTRRPNMPQPRSGSRSAGRWLALAASTCCVAVTVIAAGATPSFAAGTYSTTASVNVRSGPGTGYPLVVKEPVGAQFTLQCQWQGGTNVNGNATWDKVTFA